MEYLSLSNDWKTQAAKVHFHDSRTVSAYHLAIETNIGSSAEVFLILLRHGTAMGKVG